MQRLCMSVGHGQGHKTNLMAGDIQRTADEPEIQDGVECSWVWLACSCKQEGVLHHATPTEGIMHGGFYANCKIDFLPRNPVRISVP